MVILVSWVVVVGVELLFRFMLLRELVEVLEIWEKWCDILWLFVVGDFGFLIILVGLLILSIDC